MSGRLDDVKVLIVDDDRDVLESMDAAFQAEGALTQVELPGEAPRYETAGRQHHHHFHCRACDRVFELEGCPEGLRGLIPTGFSLESHEVVLYGRCAACAA